MVMISKKRHLVWILVSAVSCYAGPEYTTRHGLRIWDHSYNREDIEGLTAEFLALAPYGYNPFYGQNIDVFFHNGSTPHRLPRRKP